MLVGTVSHPASPKEEVSEVIAIICQPKARLQVSCPRQMFTAARQGQDCRENGDTQCKLGKRRFSDKQGYTFCTLLNRQALSLRKGGRGRSGLCLGRGGNSLHFCGGKRGQRDCGDSSAKPHSKQGSLGVCIRQCIFFPLGLVLHHRLM